MLDTSCMVAALCSWHSHHERVAAALHQRLKHQSMIVAAPTLIETYAVLTRLPPPHRLSPSVAHQLLEANFIGAPTVVTLNSSSYLAILTGAAKRSIAGGRTYDAVIAQCAVAGKASALLTLNDSDFRALAIPDLDIVVP